MKKIYYIISALSIIGIAISGILFLDHYIPNLTQMLPGCSSESGCSEFSQTNLSKIGVIPIASIGIFFYVWVFLTMQIFIEAGKSYYKNLVLILFPLFILSVIFDLILLGIMIYSKIFCLLCLITYIINIIILFLLAVMYKNKKSSDNVSFVSSVKFFLKDLNISEDKRFSFGSYIYFTSVLFLFIVSFTLYFNEKYIYSNPSNIATQQKMDYYSDLKPASIQFPKNNLVMGNPDAKVKIHIFTDPQCPACKTLFNHVKSIMPKHSKDIFIQFYFYPLDATCNKGLKTEMHKGACNISRVFYAAGESNLFNNAINYHYSKYSEIAKLCEVKASPAELASSLFSNNNEETLVQQNIKNDSVEKQLLSDIDFAETIGVDYTPTIFINGKKVENGIDKNYLEEIIKYELKN